MTEELFYRTRSWELRQLAARRQFQRNCFLIGMTLLILSAVLLVYMIPTARTIRCRDGLTLQAGQSCYLDLDDFAPPPPMPVDQ